jgi:hypothetical protein
VQTVNEIVAEMIEEYENRLKGICKMIKL